MLYQLSYGTVVLTDAKMSVFFDSTKHYGRFSSFFLVAKVPLGEGYKRIMASDLPYPIDF